ncbi:MAG: NADH-quinone oxidoreductase subunit NuoE [Pseudomonadales bacterium]
MVRTEQPIDEDEPMSEQLINPLSQEEIDAIEDEARHLPERRSAAIEALRIVQEKRGWVSDESLAAVARQLDMSADALDAIATFYNLIFREPVGRHVVMVCDSVSCYILGCDRLKRALEARLGVSTGGTTADGRFTLLPIVCLGACDRAPVLMIDEQLYGNVDPDALDEVLDEVLDQHD